jgi:hypothetical protein
MKRRGHLYREAFAGVLAITAIVTNLVSWEGEPLELVRLQGIVVALVLLTMAISEFADRRGAQTTVERAKEVAAPHV